MKLLTLIFMVFLSACSVQVVDMTSEPTEQRFDLSDVEGDGIILARDNCPESDMGAEVNNDGCGIQTIETLRRKIEVHFDRTSYVVKSEYFPEIKMFADFMKEFPQASVVIEGHTSIVGLKEYNLHLSKDRAEAIKFLLINKFSIAEERIETVGYGYDVLILTGDDESSHARNRRIVAEFSIDKIYTNMKWGIYSVDAEAQ